MTTHLHDFLSYAAQSEGWSIRSDGARWRHTDGSFIERDSPRRYVLYGDCRKLFAGPTVLHCVAFHRELRESTERAK